MKRKNETTTRTTTMDSKSLLLFPSKIFGLLSSLFLCMKITTTVQVLISTQPIFVHGFYVKYDQPRRYKKGESVPITVNKLTSPVTLSSYDFHHFALCDHNEVANPTSTSDSLYTKVHSKSQWEHSVSTLHGDMYYSASTAITNSTTGSTIQMPKGFHIPMLQETYCQHSCYINTETATSNSRNRWEYAIENDLHYHWYVDQLPAAYSYEDDNYKTNRFWGGIPIGKKIKEDDDTIPNWLWRYYPKTSMEDVDFVDGDLIFNNHYNFYIYYTTMNTNNNNEPEYIISGIKIEPLSIDHSYKYNVQQQESDNNATTTSSYIDLCRNPTNRDHITYDSLNGIPVQKLRSTTTSSSSSSPIIHFTYDIIWLEEAEERGWDIYLTMDHNTVNFITYCMSLILGIVIFCILLGSLYVWVMRDLSYKPIVNLYETEDLLINENDDNENNDSTKLTNRRRNYMDTDISTMASQQQQHDLDNTTTTNDQNHLPTESAAATDMSMQQQEQQQQQHAQIQYDPNEIQMWPLSTRLFFPPRSVPFLLCVVAGTGCQNIISSLFFIICFRFGIVSQTSHAGSINNLVTGGIVIYVLCSPIVGGYVTGRLQRILHGDLLLALTSSLVTAIAYPLLGMFITWCVYDLLPSEDAPQYHTLSNSMPVVYVWIGYVWPMTVLFGYIGYRAGPLQYFPVSKGEDGYQDLNLQETTTNSNNNNNNNQILEEDEIDITSKPSSSDRATNVNTSMDTRNLSTTEEEKKEDLGSDDGDEYDTNNYLRNGNNTDNDDNDEQPFSSYDLGLQIPSNQYMFDDYAASDCGGGGDDDDDDNNNNTNIRRSNNNMMMNHTSREYDINTNNNTSSKNRGTNDVTNHRTLATVRSRFGSFFTALHWKAFRIPVLFASCGLLPVLSIFIHYSMGMVAPIFLGYYSVRTFLVCAYLLFLLNSAAISVLVLYRQIRVASTQNQNYYYQWWWASVASGASAGFYLFLLSMTWLLKFILDDQYNVPTTTMIGYVLWFGYIAIGVGMMTGFCGLVGCILFTRSLYMWIMRRNEFA